MYEKLARDDPEFAKSIAPFAIVDDDGVKRWPASETRAFLLERARRFRPVAPLPPVKRAHPAAAPPPQTPALDPVTAPPQPATSLEIDSPPPEEPRMGGVFLLFITAVAGVGLFAVLMRSRARPKSESPE